MDSNLRVRDIAEDVYDAYKRLWTRYIPTASPMSDPPAQETPQSQASGCECAAHSLNSVNVHMSFD